LEFNRLSDTGSLPANGRNKGSAALKAWSRHVVAHFNP